MLLRFLQGDQLFVEDGLVHFHILPRILLTAECHTLLDLFHTALPKKA